ncbi:hypothetical protein Emed_003124 [Eimeria media]
MQPLLSSRLLSSPKKTQFTIATSAPPLGPQQQLLQQQQQRQQRQPHNGGRGRQPPLTALQQLTLLATGADAIR